MNIKNIFKSQEVLIQEIHDEFDTAQDRLLQEAKKILESNSLTHNEKIEQLAERLKSVGFLNTQIVREAEKIKDKRSKQQAHLDITREQAELIEYYKFNYPMLKFLTIEELDRICDKYGLIYAHVSAYKKDVPEKNLKDIECAQLLKDIDVLQDIKYCVLKPHTNTMIIGDTFAGKRHFRQRKAPYIVNQHFGHFSSADEYMRNTYGFTQPYIVDTVTNITEKRTGLFIAAPKSHFDLKGLNKKGKGFFNISIIEVKDPIVFRYVKGGVQVLTKWGLEAEDPMLVVDKMN